MTNHFTINENEKVNDLVQGMRLKISNSSDRVFEWISYNQFDNIMKILYPAIWKDGPLLHNENIMKEKVVLKCFT